MVAYSFDTCDADAILSGQRRSVIRPRRKRGNPKPGDALQIFVDLRGPDKRRLCETTCLAVAPIVIGQHCLWIDGWRIADGLRLDEIAKLEGFTGFGNFQAHFDRRFRLPTPELQRVVWSRPEAVEKPPAERLQVMLA